MSNLSMHTGCCERDDPHYHADELMAHVTAYRADQTNAASTATQATTTSSESRTGTMSYKLTCPSCDAYTSAAFRAYEDGRPCPHCGASLAAAAEQYYRQLPDDCQWQAHR